MVSFCGIGTVCMRVPVRAGQFDRGSLCERDQHGCVSRWQRDKQRCVRPLSGWVSGTLSIRLFCDRGRVKQWQLSKRKVIVVFMNSIEGSSSTVQIINFLGQIVKVGIFKTVGSRGVSGQHVNSCLIVLIVNFIGKSEVVGIVETEGSSCFNDQHRDNSSTVQISNFLGQIVKWEFSKRQAPGVSVASV